MIVVVFILPLFVVIASVSKDHPNESTGIQYFEGRSRSGVETVYALLRF